MLELNEFQFHMMKIDGVVRDSYFSAIIDGKKYTRVWGGFMWEWVPADIALKVIADEEKTKDEGWDTVIPPLG